MKRITYLICFLLGVGLTFVSCQDDFDKPVQNKGNRVRIAFETPDFVQLGTRVMSESAIADVTVLQYKDGLLIKKILLENKLFTQSVELDDLESIPATTMNTDGSMLWDGHENVIVFMANIKAITGSEMTIAEGSTLPELAESTINLIDKNMLSSLEYMPMMGHYYGGITEGITNQINVSLVRLMGKVNFTLNTANFMVDGEKPTVMVNSISLHNVPLTIRLFKPVNHPRLPANGLPGEWLSTPQTPYPAAIGGGDAGADGGIDASNFAVLEAAENRTTNNKLTNFVAYIPENARGSYTNITNNRQKIPANIPNLENRVGLTYILVDLEYTTTAGAIRNAKYKIYLGGDDSGDMNLLTNVQYNVTTYIYGDGGNASDTDTRITVTAIFDPSVTNPGSNSIQAPANCYMINTASIPTNFTIPLTQARGGWRYIQTTRKLEGDETNYTKAFDDMIASGWTIETLWKTWDDGKNITGTVAANNLTTAMGANGNKYYATLDIPAGIPNGNNCVIALKDGDGKIWWSWHLWLTDYNPDAPAGSMNGQTQKYFSEAFTVAGLYYNKRLMDRHLGATITDVDDSYIQSQPLTTEDAVKWYGLLYQWGRKDPFTGSGDGTTMIANAVAIYNTEDTKYSYDSGTTVGEAMNGDQIKTDGTINSTDGFPKVANGNVDIYRVIDAIRNPMHFYYLGVRENWTISDNNLWNITTKSPFDPCPSGWRIPAGGNTATYNPWSGFSTGVYNNASNGSYGTIWGNQASGPFPTITAVTSPSTQVGTSGRLYGASDNLGTGTFASTSGTANWFGGDNSIAWYPSTGRRNSASGAFLGTGYVWTVTSTAGYLFAFNEGSVYPSFTYPCGSGHSVRCIQD